MTKRRRTRRALINSVISLLICFSMLLGTTFAWFTDSVSSTKNQIIAGNLDIELEYSKDMASWTSVEGKSDVIDPEALWEPGHTEVVYLRLSNLGTLALKYQFAMTVADSVIGKSVEGNDINLSKYLKYNIIDVTAKYEDRDAARKAAEVGAVDLANYTVSGEMEAEEAAKTVALVVYMPETVGNEANYRGNKIPTIELGLNVFATQLVSENDSFGPDYDAAATWTGDADLNWYYDNATATEFTLNSAEDLAGLAELVNGTAKAPTTTYARAAETTVKDDFAGKTIKLGANINLNDIEWTPIGTWDTPFSGNFDGQGYTISNLNINEPAMEGVGLFGVATDANITGIKVNNVDILGYTMVATIVGSPYTGCTISNCHVTGDVNLVADYAYVGGIAGYGYMDIENCSVIANAGKGLLYAKERNAVGGISAWLLEGSSSVINCQVKNLDLIGWSNVGGITGFVHYSNVIDGCSAENLTLTKTRADGHPGIGLASGGWSYHANNAITIKNNTFKNIELNGTYVAVASADKLYGSEYGGALTGNFVTENNTEENIDNNLVEVTKVTSADSLIEALESGENVVLTSNVKIEPAAMSNAYGTTGINVKNGQTIDGCGNILDIKGAGGTWDSGISTTGGLIKNITVTGSFRGIFINHNSTHSEKVVLENVIIDGTVYTISCDQGTGKGLEATNSTFNGWTSYAKTLGNAKFVDCNFGEGSGYAYCRPYAPTEFVNCEFEAGFTVDPVAAVTFENCTFDGVALTAENIETLVTNATNVTIK